MNYSLLTYKIKKIEKMKNFFLFFTYFYQKGSNYPIIN